MRFRDRLIRKLLVGALLGVFVGVLISDIFPNGEPSEAPLTVIILLYAVMGMIGYGGAIVYEIERLGLLTMTLIHYFCTIGFFILMGTILNFGTLSMYLIMIGIETVVYFIIWGIQFIRWRREVKEMNEELEAAKKQPEDDEKIA